MEIKLAFSPCPNDTFIFHHLIESGTKNLSYEPVFLDVSELNRQAIQNQNYPITKLSFAALTLLEDHYHLLDCGGALGRGCGPLLIHNKKISENQSLPKIKKILIPGKYTTANLLLHLYLTDKGVQTQDIEFIPTRYDLIVAALKSGKADFGLLIHEERFTYKKLNLEEICDLGDWWENETGHVIPLGCICVKKNLETSLISEIEQGIRSSIQHAYDHPTDSIEFIKQHSQSIEDEVISSHIKLYVNDFSLSYGKQGRAAIQELFKRARRISIH